MIKVKAFGLGEYPVNAGNRNASSTGSFRDFQPLTGRNIGDIFGEGEGGYLNGVVARRGGVSHGFFKLPTLENFVADSEFHFAGITVGMTLN